MKVLAQESPIIVCGAARSGTTYLVQILNRHPDVYISNETRIFVWAHESLHTITENQRVFFREKGKFTDFMKKAYPELIVQFYRELHPGLRHWGDKNPHYLASENAGCLETLMELFQATKIIHIIRDGRDVIASGLRGVWRDFEKVHDMWKSHVDNGRAFGEKLPGNQYLELRYEELIADDVGMAEVIFSFLEIDIHPRVLNFCRAQRKNRTPFCAPSRDIGADVAASDWANVLTPQQQVSSLEKLGSHLVTYGYETEETLASIREGLSSSALAEGKA